MGRHFKAILHDICVPCMRHVSFIIIILFDDGVAILCFGGPLGFSSIFSGYVLDIVIEILALGVMCSM